jgi:hypothetical protein
MGTRTNIIADHTVPDPLDRTAVLDRLAPALPEAMAVRDFWNAYNPDDARMEPRDLEWDRMSFRLNDHSRSSISSNHHYGSYLGPHVIAAGARASPDNQVVASLSGSIAPQDVKALF